MTHLNMVTLQTKEESVDVHKKKVEELQIALLECAMEYEVKVISQFLN